MILYVIRHADPDYSIDSLTEFGWKEAEALGERMAKSKLDLIYTSPRGRAIATSEPTCRRTGIKGSIEQWMNEDMHYMRTPQFSEADQRATKYEFSFDKGVQGFTEYHHENPREEFLAKMIASSDEFFERHGYKREGGLYKIIDGGCHKRVACFCHGGFGSAWMAHLMGYPPAFGWMKFQVRTTSVSKFVFSDYNKSGYAQVQCEYLGDTSHIHYIGGLKNNLR